MLHRANGSDGLPGFPEAGLAYDGVEGFCQSNGLGCGNEKKKDS